MSLAIEANAIDLAAIKARPSPNQDDRTAGSVIDTLVLHYTGMQSGQAAIDRLCNPAARVSSHYVVGEDGAIVRLVEEQRRAYHAGISCWRGRPVLNDRSVGIEIVNPGHEWGYRPFPRVQMQSLTALCRSILSRHPIPARNVVAHSDIAPDRKQDPGELFDWRGLADAGIGLWPDGDGAATTDDASSVVGVRQRLIAIGYAVAPDGEADAPLASVLRAFQRHWRQETISGVADAGTRARIAALSVVIDAA